MECQIVRVRRRARRPRMNRKCYGLRGQKSTRRSTCSDLPAIMAVRHGVDTCNWPALAVRLGARRFGPPASPLDFSARSWPHLLLGVFLAGISDSRIDWAARNSSCRRIPAGGGGAGLPPGLLVCADAGVVFEQCSRACRNLLGVVDWVPGVGFYFVAGRVAGSLFSVISFFCG